jgi:hypothetical protein
MFAKEFKLTAAQRLAGTGNEPEHAAGSVRFGRVRTKTGTLPSSKPGLASRHGDRFFEGCLQRIEEQRMLQALTGNSPSTGRSKKK